MKIFGVRAVDVINPVKWVSFLRGIINVRLRWPPHVIEQVMIRLIECDDCVKLGKCIDCGCSMPAKAYDLKARCSLEKWVEVELDKDIWEQKKQDYKIKINVTYGL